MGKERIIKSTTRQDLWFTWKTHHHHHHHHHHKHASYDEELQNFLGSKIARVILQAQQASNEDNEEEDESLFFQIKKCSLEQVDDQGELDLPAEDIIHFSNPAPSVPESFPNGALEMAAKKKQCTHSHRPFEVDPQIDPQIAEFYSRVGTIMQSVSISNNQISDIYLKGFKVIPLLSNWEEIVLLTRPDLWCPEATHHATLVFFSFHKYHQLKSFLEHILLKRCLEFIRAHGFLNRHLYSALRQVIHANPTLFCKTLIPSLVGSGCDLKEASIFGGILTKVHIPGLTCANILLILAQMSSHYSISHSVFILVLLQKKPVLSFRVVSSLVDHFCDIKGKESKMPLLWYQSMYLFIDVYGVECIMEQKERLLETSQYMFHHHWSPIVGELVLKLIGSSDTGSQQD
ncbi:Bystin-domain-containing protein [Chlamydoabsidia padenii]|nr:Bystin-domain-containing protein [Chlamydoabsidia padenii]